MSERRWFEQGGEAYARYRPNYPSSLARYLAGLAPCTRLAVDVGCGTGQLASRLGDHFDEVVASDVSASQIAHAASHPHVRYCVARAERLPVDDASVCLVAAAQAAHWFDLPRFYDEVRRVSVPGAAVALVSYAAPRLQGALGRRFETFYEREIGPFWPPERQLVDSGYGSLPFPFREHRAPPIEIQLRWDAAEFLGYVSTWSATLRAQSAGEHALLERFASDLLGLWGEPTTVRSVVWPIRMRVGEVT